MYATPALKETIERQGRRSDWVAGMVGLSKAQFSHIVSGRRPIDVEKASRVAALLGVPVFFVFQLPDGNQKTIGRQLDGAAA